MTHFNNLTPAQAERLAILSEEMGEVIQVIGKILRHGYESQHPNGGPNNQALLEKELGDVYAAIDMLEQSKDVRLHLIDLYAKDKSTRIRPYLHHQDDKK